MCYLINALSLGKKALSTKTHFITDKMEQNSMEELMPSLNAFKPADCPGDLGRLH